MKERIHYSYFISFSMSNYQNVDGKHKTVEKLHQNPTIKSKISESFVEGFFRKFLLIPFFQFNSSALESCKQDLLPRWSIIDCKRNVTGSSLFFRFSVEHQNSLLLFIFHSHFIGKVKWIYLLDVNAEIFSCWSIEKTSLIQIAFGFSLLFADSEIKIHFNKMNEKNFVDNFQTKTT